MSNLVPITVAYRDGIGPEIMEASLHVIKSAGPRIQTEVMDIREKVYLRGNTAGSDVYVERPSLETNKLASAAQKANGDGLDLIMIDNRAVKKWPDGITGTQCTDSYRCWFTSKNGTNSKQTMALLNRVLDQGVEIAKTKSLRTLDGKPGYTLAPGQ